MISRLFEFYKDLRFPFNFLPFVDACRFAWATLTKKSTVLDTSFCGIPLSLRTNSPDLLVSYSALFKNEFASIKTDSPKVILDAGANIGTTSIAFARQYPEAEILAVEMEPENLELLRRNTKSFPNIKVIPMAITGHSGERVIKDRNTGQWGYTIAESADNAENTTHTVSCVTIDQLMAAHGITHIDILKMDIEGAEKEIFETGGQWLGKTESIAIELHERIAPGCSRAFYLATEQFEHVENHGEKVVLYRKTPSMTDK